MTTPLSIYSPSLRGIQPRDLIGSQPQGYLRSLTLQIKAAFARAAVTSEDCVLVACSGGADSLAMALGIADFTSRRGIPCRALSVDHGLRSASVAEARAVAATLHAWGIRARSHHFPRQAHANYPRLGPEGGARELRYQALRAYASECLNAGARRVFIALGHTADDQAETVLLRLARGSGVGSLRAMAELTTLAPQIFALRPILALRRSDTEGACTQAGLTPIEDPTNSLEGEWTTRDGQPLRRSALRHVALPALTRALGSDPTPSLVRTAQQAADEDDALNFYADQAYGDLRRDDETLAGAHLAFDARGCAGYPRAIRLRLYHRAAIEAGARPGDLTHTHLNEVDRLVTEWKGQAPLNLPGAQAVRKSTLLYFVRA